MFFAYLGFFGPVFYVQSYAIQTGTMSKDLAFYLLSILNAASTPGRILLGYLGGKLGPINVLLPTTAICGILALSWIGIHQRGWSHCFRCTLWLLFWWYRGLWAGVTLTSLTPDLDKAGNAYGNVFGDLRIRFSCWNANLRRDSFRYRELCRTTGLCGGDYLHDYDTAHACSHLQGRNKIKNTSLSCY